jgi:hypothetical protein
VITQQRIPAVLIETENGSTAPPSPARSAVVAVWWRARSGRAPRRWPLMVDYSPPPDPPSPDPAPRPSKIDALKTAASGPAATVVALVTALSGLTAAITTWSDSQATARVAYETLRLASERNAVQIEACRQSQLQQTSWIEELSGRLERRQVTTEKAIKAKVTRPAAAPVPAPVVEPAPPAPAPPIALEPSALPPFEALALRAQRP